MGRAEGVTVRNVGNLHTFADRVFATAEYFGWSQVLRAVGRAMRTSASRSIARPGDREALTKAADALDNMAREMEREIYLARKR